ncbi:MAG: nucleotidyltransferase domain-containing protein [Polyangiaceae bacterium]|nr:nucleotidyltransferase domain-containing protein [Polyangiaceae bacterium]
MNARGFERIREVLERLPGVRIAYLFGSTARGQDHETSDVDLAVVLGASSPLDEDILREELEQSAGRHVDLIVLDKAPPLLVAEVLREGHVLLCRDEDERAQFELRAQAIVFDTEHWRAVQRGYLRERAEERRDVELWLGSVS